MMMSPASALVALVLLPVTINAASCMGNRGGATSCASTWVHAGPAGYTQMDANPDGSQALLSAGAAQTVVDAGQGTWFLGSANGGVWRTRDITAPTPHWQPVTDSSNVACTSISAIAAGSNLVVAGCGGATSSEMGHDWNVLNDGDWGGLMSSTDGGDSWTMINSFPANYYITGILILETGGLVVSARSNFFDAEDGGIWVSDATMKSWRKTFSQPVFNLALDKKTSSIYAAIPFPANASVSVMRSMDKGVTFSPFGAGISYQANHQPFYPCLAIGPDALFYGALTVNVTDSTKTNSVVYKYPTSGQNSMWTPINGGPDPDGSGLDDDAMPKDRMALLPHPTNPDLLFVAGNAAKLAYRVHLPSQNWTDLTGADTVDGSAPHCDCRNYAWDSVSGSLLLVSDGGVFRRIQPSQSGGRWVSTNGDYGGMEYVTASWDYRQSRWVAGAQDNDVQVARPNANATAAALGFIMGDGMITAVDNQHSPARLYGTIQFMGSKRDDGDRRQRRQGGLETGFCFVEGHPPKRTCLSTVKWGFGPENFPFFQQPYDLNQNDQSKLVMWVKGILGKQQGFYEISFPDNSDDVELIAPPRFIAGNEGDVYTLVTGGMTRGSPDPSLLVAMNDTSLFFRSNLTTGGAVRVRALPTTFAQPHSWGYNQTTGQPILGPVSHGKTVSLAVSSSNSALMAVTGRPSVADNNGVESIHISRNEGLTWIDVTGNLDAVTATVGRSRPSALLIVNVPSVNSSALLVGTVAGVFVSWTDSLRLGRWSRLGQCTDIPLVLTLGLSHEKNSDTIVAATFGRGVYVIHNATSSLLRSRMEQDNAGCIGVQHTYSRQTTKTSTIRKVTTTAHPIKLPERTSEDDKSVGISPITLGLAICGTSLLVIGYVAYARRLKRCDPPSSTTHSNPTYDMNK